MSYLCERSYSALMYDTLEEYQAAISELSDYIESHPINVSALNNRGIAYWETGELEKAQDDFKRAAQHSKLDILPVKHWGMLLEKQGNLEGAIDKYRQCIQSAPKDASMNRCLAHIYVKEQKYADALPYLSEAIRCDKFFRQTYLDRADVYEKLGRGMRAKIDRLIAKLL